MSQKVSVVVHGVVELYKLLHYWINTWVVFRLPIMHLVGTTVFTTTHTWEISSRSTMLGTWSSHNRHHTNIDKFCTLFNPLLTSCSTCIDTWNVLNSKFSNIAVFTCYTTHFTHFVRLARRETSQRKNLLMPSLFTTSMKTLIKHHWSSKLRDKSRIRKGGNPLFWWTLMKCDMEQLMHLLVVMMMIGSEKQLANFFLVASTSTASLLIPVTLLELCVRTFTFWWYFQWSIILTSICLFLFSDSTKEEREKFISHYTQSIGTRFLDASNLIVELRAKETKTLEMAKQEADNCISARKMEYQAAILAFILMFNNVDHKMKKRLLTALLEGTLMLSEASKAVQITEEEFISQSSTPSHVHRPRNMFAEH